MVFNVWKFGLLRMSILAMVTCLMGSLAAEVAPDTPKPATSAADAVVAAVDGRPITLGAIEVQLLRREGAEAVGEIAKIALEKADWRALADDAILLTLPTGTISRQQVLAELMAQHQQMILEEQINIAVVRSELARRGVVIDEALIRGEVARADHKLEAMMTARDMPRMDLDSFLRESQNTTLAEYTAQPGFRVLIAGLHALVRMEAIDAIGEATLRAQYDADPARFAIDEAVDCSSIFIPYRTETDADGNKTVTDAERTRLETVFGALYAQICAEKITFGTAFKAYARSYDPDAAVDGRLGWIRRDGHRGRPDARVLAPEVVQAIFSARGPFPMQLPPIIHADGIDLPLVHGWRPASQPDYAAVRDQLAAELVEKDLDRRSQTSLVRLRQAAAIRQRDDGTILVGDTEVKRRDIEDAILIRYGSEEAVRYLSERLDAIDWSSLSADTPVLSGSGWGVERSVLIARLLERHAANVREDLIGIELLRGAVDKAGITVDSSLVEREIGRLSRAYARSQESTSRDFERFVHASYGSTLADLRLDPAFRALAGCGELMRRSAEVSEADLQAWFAAHRTLYSQREAVDLSLVTLPHRALNAAGLTDADRDRTRKAAGQIYDLLVKGAGFPRMWREYGRRNDPTTKDGNAGWVAADGKRSNPGARVIPAEVMTQAFAAKAPFPVLLPPIEHRAGIDLVQVNGHRAARDPALDAIRDEVRRDCLEGDWDERLQVFVDDLRRTTKVDYEELPALVQARIAELQR